MFSNIKKDTKTLGGIEKTGGCVGVFILMRLGLAGGFDSFVKPENICQGGFHPKDEISPTNSEVNDLTVTVSSMFPFLIGVANKNPFPIFISGVWFKRTIPS